MQNNSCPGISNCSSKCIMKSQFKNQILQPQENDIKHNEVTRTLFYGLISFSVQRGLTGIYKVLLGTSDLQHQIRRSEAL